MHIVSLSTSRTVPHGFTLVEIVVAISVLLLVALGMYQAFTTTMQAVRNSESRIAGIALVNEQMEIVRNLTYDNVGIEGGIPEGSIPHIQTLVRDGFEFTVTAIVRNIDNPFDGQIGSSTKNDLAPADYRLVELTIECASCQDFAPMSFTSFVGPRGLESSSNNGALFIHVFDATGQPIQGADVHVENNLATTSIVIDETTDNNGYLQIIDTPPGVHAYEISVSKNGYSSDQSYTIGAVGNPNPSKPHSTVLKQQLSQVSFSIDRVSELQVTSMTDACVPIPNIDFALAGSKLIGTAPDVKKFSNTFMTNGSGLHTISNLEWDTYDLSYTDAGYDLLGTTPTVPFIINPGVQQNISLIVAPKNPRTLLVTVKDQGTKLPLSDADVRLESASYDQTKITGKGFRTQTDWSGGDGQSTYTDTTKYFSDSGSLEFLSPTGQLQLWKGPTEYNASGFLISSTFDTGTSSTFQQILWQPQSQPPAVGSSSVRVQIATNNDDLTWDFKGPDGTSGTYYDLSQQDIFAGHSGNRYLRYKLFLQTASTTWTPTVSDISFTLTSSCIPPGQVAYSGLNADTYTITVTKNGYQNYSGTVTVSSDWQQTEILLTP